MGFFADVTERKFLEDGIERINLCLLGLGNDFKDNIGKITELCGELLGGTCALYNRLNEGMLCAIGQWQTPPDFNPRTNPEGHICYDLIKGAGTDGLLFIPDLSATRYAETDVNVRLYGLKSYLGHVVYCNRENVGSLCVVFQRPFQPTENDKRLL